MVTERKRRRRRKLRVSSDHGTKRVILSVVGLGMIVVGVSVFLSGCSLVKEGDKAWRDHTRNPGMPFTAEGNKSRDDAWDEMSEKNDEGHPRIAIGMFTTMFGLGLISFANRSVLARYQAGEMVPVVNDAAHDLAPTVRRVARAVGREVRRGKKASAPPPDRDNAGRIKHECGTYNDPDDRFCKGCGTSLAKPICKSCGTENDLDARFCDSCGTPLA